MLTVVQQLQLQQLHPITNPTVLQRQHKLLVLVVTGAVTLAGSGGSGVYQYSFNGSPFTTTATYPGLRHHFLISS
jgi:hypothetical protein